jgi:hypothetical protein
MTGVDYAAGAADAVSGVIDALAQLRATLESQGKLGRGPEEDAETVVKAASELTFFQTLHTDEQKALSIAIEREIAGKDIHYATQDFLGKVDVIDKTATLTLPAGANTRVVSEKVRTLIDEWGNMAMYSATPPAQGVGGPGDRSMMGVYDFDHKGQFGFLGTELEVGKRRAEGLPNILDKDRYDFYGSPNIQTIVPTAPNANVVGYGGGGGYEMTDTPEAEPQSGFAPGPEGYGSEDNYGYADSDDDGGLGTPGASAEGAGTPF